ncbi:MAG: peptidoglycan-binding protein [Myxococcota bacterium]|jgi:peptidoglycan hydrolase-like protein with peptidoglycan-binding domain
MTIRVPPRPVFPVPVPPAPSAAAVRKAEALLKKAGFNPGTVDGKPTPAFTESLKQFQKAWGLPATGEPDARTLARLEETAHRIAVHAKKKDRHLFIGQKSGGVLNAEKRLRALGYQPGAVDGVYSRDTARAVKAFRADQKELKNGVGSLGKASRKLLEQEVAALHHAPERRRLAPTKAQAKADAQTNAAVRAHHSDGTVGLGVGSQGGAVKNVQKHLTAAGFRPKHWNGKFDERTEAAVKAFQKHSKLDVTGRVDAKTWKALKQSFILTTSKASPAQALYERSGAVKGTEKLLRQAGFNPGKVDGFFDRKTRAAVKAFEKKHHLRADGKISGKDLSKLKQAAKGDYRDKVLDVARKYLGFHEGAGNVNPFSKYFGRGPEAWCADFVSYCYSKAGKKLNEPWTPALLAKLKANGTYTRNHPKPGDIIMFDWHPGSGPTAEHTGLVEKVFRRNGQLWVQTIEGNSGDMVRRRSYPVSSSSIAGFGTIR